MPDPLLVLVPMVEGPMRRVALGAAETLRAAWSGPVLLLPPPDDWNATALPHCAGAVAFLKPTGLPSSPPSFPVVNAGYHYLHIPFPSVATDPVAIGRLAAEHLAGLPVARRAVLDDPIPEIAARGAACVAALAGRGVACETWAPSRFQDPAWLAALADGDGSTALYAGSDRRAEMVMNRALAAGIAVPARLAILATDDNELVQVACPVPLSTITVPAAGVGRTAAGLLLDLLAGRPRPDQPVLLAPGRVAVRASTTMPAADAAVAAALTYLAAQVHRQFSIAEVARHVGLARRTLEERFRHQRGLALGEALAHLRLHRACELLERSDRGISDIAAAVGYATPSGLTRLFASLLGRTPSEYRLAFGDPGRSTGQD